MDCSPPGSSINGIFRARVLEWGAIAFSMTNLDSIFKIRDIIWSTKIHLVKAMIFPVVMYGCESWTVTPKNWCFWTMMLQKTLESPLDCKEIQPMHLEGNHSWICIERTDVEAGEGVNRGWDSYMASLIPWIWVWVNSRIWWWTRKPGIQQSMGSQRFKHDWATELNWMLLR